MVLSSHLMVPEGSAASRYRKMEFDRRTYLDAARDSSLLTIPALVPLEGWDPSQRLPTPYQSIGARGVNNLASKLLLALLPPNSPFFRLRVDPFVLEEISADEQAHTEVEARLHEIESAVQVEVETSGLRPRFFEGLKHLIVSGNIVVHVPDGDGETRLFHLDQFVVQRDAEGNLLTIIIEEQISAEMLSPELRATLSLDPTVRDRIHSGRDLRLYTVVDRLDANEFEVFQEIEGVIDPESVGIYAADSLPWNHVRWNQISGESYGRGHVEEYLGDLTSLEGLSQAMVEGSAAAARVLFLVNPNGQTSPRVLEEAPNGGVRKGRAEDVSVLKLEKQADLQVALQMIRDIRDRLGFGFLLNTSVTRDAERVTAEEIRFVAQELEDALGGAYSMLSQEFQLPFVSRVLDKMAAQGRIPQLPERLVKPQVVTGLEALGRGHDLTRLRVFTESFAGLLGPEVLLQHMHVSDLLKRGATAAHIDPDGLLKTAEELAQEAQRNQVMQWIEQLGPNAVQVIGNMMTQAAQTGALPGAPTSGVQAPANAGV